MANIYLIHILIVFLLFYKINSIIVLPFKTFIKDEPKKINTSTLMNYLSENIIYTEGAIGEPAKNISIIINSKSFDSNLYNHRCDIPTSQYERLESKSFKIVQLISGSYNGFYNPLIINETIYLYDDLSLKELKPIKEVKLFYSNNDKEEQKELYEYHVGSCINVGLQITFTGTNSFVLIPQISLLLTFDGRISSIVNLPSFPSVTVATST